MLEIIDRGNSSILTILKNTFLNVTFFIKMESNVPYYLLKKLKIVYL